MLIDSSSSLVLPFQSMSGDWEHKPLPTAWWEDIIAALSHFTLLFAIARNSNFIQASLAASAS
jgi:TolB-like protein